MKSNQIDAYAFHFKEIINQCNITFCVKMTEKLQLNYKFIRLTYKRCESYQNENPEAPNITWPDENEDKAIIEFHACK